MLPFTRWPVMRVAIAERSMQPALMPGEWWLVRRWGPVRPGSVVVLEQPGRLGLLVVKRAIREVPGGWWVEGDNSEVSTDSRAYGPVPTAAIRGVLWFRYGRGR